MTGLSNEYLFVAAIDFGTTYSGYAFSSRHDFSLDPLKIVMNIWTGSQLMSHKTPTCVLFDPYKKFSKFGFEAEDEYTKMASGEKSGNHRDWFFFRQFKMTLFDKTTLQMKYMLTDETGKQMEALQVFAAAINYMKDHMMKTCKKTVGSSVAESDIRWILTVPAIWTDGCKQFMREAATKAGIDNSTLLIALEPEAASICCRFQPLQANDRRNLELESFQPGSEYVVIDAGGGTVDITVHKIDQSGRLRELHASSGGNWGSIYVDRSFHNFIESIVGKDKMHELQSINTDEYIDLFREFEVKKRNIGSSDEAILILAPYSLSALLMEKITSDVHLKRHISWKAGKLKIDKATFSGFFECVCQKIVEHLDSLFQSAEVDNVTTILMVGGFSASLFLQTRIRERFCDKKIIVPTDPDLAVLKGAVIFGHDPTVIEERRCRKTYGVSCGLPFRKGIDPEQNKMINDNGEVCCYHRFDTHVKIGDVVKFGESRSVRMYRPMKINQNNLDVAFFASTNALPQYTYEADCQHIGNLNIKLEGSGVNRYVDIKIIFGGSELIAEATERNSGRKLKATLNFLG